MTLLPLGVPGIIGTLLPYSLSLGVTDIIGTPSHFWLSLEVPDIIETLYDVVSLDIIKGPFPYISCFDLWESLILAIQTPSELYFIHYGSWMIIKFEVTTKSIGVKSLTVSVKKLYTVKLCESKQSISLFSAKALLLIG